MNRLVSCLKQNLIQLAFQQCSPITSVDDFTFCFNYCDREVASKSKIILKSIKQMHAAETSLEPNAKKYKLTNNDNNNNMSRTSTSSSRQRRKLKYSKVTIRIGNSPHQQQQHLMSSNRRYTQNKQVNSINKFNSTIKVILNVLICLTLNIFIGFLSKLVTFVYVSFLIRFSKC